MTSRPSAAAGFLERLARPPLTIDDEEPEIARNETSNEEEKDAVATESQHDTPSRSESETDSDVSQVQSSLALENDLPKPLADYSNSYSQRSRTMPEATRLNPIEPGTRIGRLIVLGPGQALFERVKCDCGNVVEKRRGDLRKGLLRKANARCAMDCRLGSPRRARKPRTDTNGPGHAPAAPPRAKPGRQSASQKTAAPPKQNGNHTGGSIAEAIKEIERRVLAVPAAEVGEFVDSLSRVAETFPDIVNVGALLSRVRALQQFQKALGE